MDYHVYCSTLCEKMKLLTLGGYDGYLVIFGMDSHDQLLDEQIHDDYINDVKLTTDFLCGKEEEGLIFTGSDDFKIKIHKINANKVKDSFQLLITLTGHT